MNFIASAQDPEKQLVMFEKLGQGPANPAADALIPEDQKRINPVDPANMAKQIPLDMEWYAKNYGPAPNAFIILPLVTAIFVDVVNVFAITLFLAL